MGIVIIFTLVTTVLSIDANERPNIVLFIADDLGIGDVGCFGNDTLRTPRLDQMAREGVRLTQHLAGASHCTPSRATLLTGRYAIRSGMASGDGALRFLSTVASTAGLPPNETTIAEIAKEAGYKTALFGKWHLGLHENFYGDYTNSPVNQGFDYFFGLPWTNVKDFGADGTNIATIVSPYWRHSLISVILMIWISLFSLYYHGVINSKVIAIIVFFAISSPFLFLYFVQANLNLLNSVLVRNREVIEQPVILQNLTQRLIHEGVNFIDKRRQDGAPFLMVMSWVHVHTYIATNPRFSGKSLHGKYGDAVEELDWSVGRILDTLDEKGVGFNTFAYFTSDNGGHLEERGANNQPEGGWNGVYKGGKLHGAVDGGIRVPTIVRWPARIPKGTVTREPTIFMDVLPTLASIMGTGLPRDRIIDGKDMIPLLSGTETITSHRFMVHYCGETIHAARYRPPTGSTTWKLVYYRAAYLLTNTYECIAQCTCSDVIHLGEPELHDINMDPGERFPVDYSRDKRLQNMVEYMKTQTQKHKQSVVAVPKQFTFSKLIWRLSLQSCCGGPFPFCSCKENHGLDFELS